MSFQINVAEAKAKLSALIDAAERGEDVMIARAGVPAVRLMAVAAKPKRPKPGILRDRYGYTLEAPYGVFAPDPEDAIDSPLMPGDLKS